jgi:hypothetical protein
VKSHNLREVTLFVQNTSDLKEKTLKNNPQSHGVSAVPRGCMAVGESVANSALWDTRRPPSCIVALPSVRAFLGGLSSPPPFTRGTMIEKIETDTEHEDLKE